MFKWKLSYFGEEATLVIDADNPETPGQVSFEGSDIVADELLDPIAIEPEGAKGLTIDFNELVRANDAGFSLATQFEYLSPELIEGQLTTIPADPENGVN